MALFSRVQDSSVGSIMSSEDCALFQKIWDSELLSLLNKIGYTYPYDSAFVINSLARVSSPNYIASDEDIIRFSCSTVGNCQYKLKFEEEWSIQDVGSESYEIARWSDYILKSDRVIFAISLDLYLLF